MPANTGTVKIEIRVDDKGTVKVKKFGDQSEKAFKRTGKSVGDFDRKVTTSNASLMKMQSILVGLLGTYGLYKLASALNDCVKAASDLEEVTSKFNVVFAEQAKKAEEWARVLQDAYAMSMREAKQYLSSIQDLLVPMGMNARAAAYLSNEIVKLSADLGSFNNLPTAQVMLDIQSALVGNYETMKKYGIVVNATITQEKALAMGLADTKDELTVAQKAFAAYTLILEGSKAAIGDMARTSNSYANQLKAMKANIEDMRAEIGNNLLPVLSDWLKSINAIIKAWSKLVKGPSAIDASLEIMETKAKKLRAQIEAIGLQLRAVKKFGWGDTWGVSIEKLQKRLKTLNEELKDTEASIQFWKLEKVAKLAADHVGDIRDGIEEINVLLKETATQSEKVEEKFRDMWQDWAGTEEWVEKSKKAVTEFEVWKAEEKKKEVKKTEKTVNEMEEIYKNFLRNVQSNFADTFYDIFSGQLDSFDDFLDSMKKAFLRMLAEMAAAAAMKKIVIPMAASMAGAVGGTGSGAGGMMGSIGQVGGMAGGMGGTAPGWMSTLGQYAIAAYVGWTAGQMIGKWMGLGPQGGNANYRFGEGWRTTAEYTQGQGFDAISNIEHHGGGKDITNAVRELYEQMVNQANAVLKSVPMKFKDEIEPYLESIVFRPTDYKFKFKNAEQVIQAMAEKWTAQVEEAFNKAARAAGNASFAEMLAWDDISWQASVMGGAVSDLEVQIHNINEQFDAWIQQLEDLGSSEERLAEIEKYRAMALEELTEASSQYGRQIESLQATILRLATGMDSPLDAEERMALIKKEINTLMAGDMNPEDVSKIQALWMDYLRVAQEMYQRPSIEYQAIYAEVTAALNELITWLKAMKEYQSGGYVTETGPAIVHRGERVIPAGGGASVVVNFQPSIRVDGSGDSMRASREIQAGFERFMRGRGRKIVQEAVKYQ